MLGFPIDVVILSPPMVNVRVLAVAVAAVTAGVCLPASAGAAAAKPAAGTVTLSVSASAPATAALRRAKVTVAGVSPAKASRTRWTLPVNGKPVTTARSVALGGRLRFARGKRKVTFTALRLSLGAKPTISGTTGKRRVTVLTLSGTPVRSATAGTISLRGSRVSLAATGARVLRSGLKVPGVKAGRLGTATVAVRGATAAPKAPATPTPVTPTPKTPAVVTPPVVAPPVVTPPVTPTPDPPAPTTPCWAPTPAGNTDWVACDGTVGGNLWGWVNYITNGGTIEATDGAALVAPGNKYDYRLGVASTPVESGDGTVTISHAGGFRYWLPVHFLDISIVNLRIRVAADRASAVVIVDGSYTPWPAAVNVPPVPVPVVDAVVMTVDLTAARSRTAVDGVTTYELAPAALTSEGRRIWGDFYPVGSRFGAFTVAVPD